MSGAVAIEQQTEHQLDKLLTVLTSINEEVKGRQIDTYYSTTKQRRAYTKHLEAFRATSLFRVIGVMGSNRCGKSTLACYLASVSLTGQYPTWWEGKKFSKPINAWVVAVTQAQCRDNLQSKLLGEHGQIGTGLIPADSIVEVRKRQGVPGAIEFVRVKHVSGGVSTLSFKAASEGREAFQSVRIDLAILDEEPPWEVFEEVLMRTVATSKHEQAGTVLLAFTPLKGLSQVASHLMPDGLEDENKSRDVCTVNIPWNAVPHLSQKEKDSLLDSIPHHQRDARLKGLPVLGVGAVYQYSEDELTIKPFAIPPYFWGGYGLDVGWNFTAAIFLYQDPDSKTLYVTSEYKRSELTPIEHTANIKLNSKWQTGAIDPASRGRSQLDGRNLMTEYQAEGLTLKPAVNAVEAGLFKVQNLITSGQLKVFNTCPALLAEFRKYHRNDLGRIVKQDDHLLDALRYAINTPRIFRPPGPWIKPVNLSKPKRVIH